MESVQSNPLPASLEVKAKDIKNLSTLSEEFAKFEGVDRVKFFRDVVDSFRKWSTILKISGFVLLFVLGLISVLMILITIGITINSKGIEVEIMKLVGATDKYVKFPLILQGVFYGVAASFIAGILMLLMTPLFKQVVSSLFKGIPAIGGFWTTVFWARCCGSGSETLIQRFLIIVGLFVFELVFGVVVGYIGSNLAIKKYLKY